ncbi:helix-turn-helix transcriptional regulator [Curtobacterium sp. BRD11]|uniref:helix-turn-helix domain-containing protein n=1 Tax=Curtobacterium sp. BRD11 TaxID=2962581 RepID=UPI002880DD51|nr:helix-turn-helix transcriptional regulator [Curtobacterium sp. BRD11]MDT0211202.1 helix-turn-helix transcriptional regulator [Curtobacterium sp. BRD11]
MTNADTTRGVAERIENIRKIEGRSVAWLSEASGISYKTLRRRIYGAPEQFTLSELSSIARSLNTDVEHLVVALEPAA